MTRETKIGLLVGLAFIIVVGILLSEHLTTTTERPAAPLAEAGRSVQTAISTPGTSTISEPPIARAVEPQQPVPTARELTPVQPPLPATAQVSVGGPVSPPILIEQTVETPAPAQAPIVTQVPVAPQTPIITQTPAVPQQPQVAVVQPPVDPFANDPLAHVARANGEQLVPVAPVVPAPASERKSALASAPAREYKAQPGDTLSRIAALLPGGNTKTNRDAVVALNPTLQKDPNKVFAGRTYLLPTQPGAIQPVAPKTPAPLVAKASPVEKTPVKSNNAGGFRTYTVQRGDTLSSIASEQMGSVKELPELRKLNQDVLKGRDVIWVDMKLKLPARSVASNG